MGVESDSMAERAVESSAGIFADLNEKEQIRVLHVDDDSSFLDVAKQCLEVEGSFQVDTAFSVCEALEKMKSKTYDVIISDYQMPGKDGLGFLKELRQEGNTIPFIMFTGKGREEVAVRALNLGANQYLNKAGDPETVYAGLAHCLREAVRSAQVLAERKETEKIAEKSERKYRSLFSAMSEGVCFHEIVYNESAKAVDYIITDVNSAFESITGIRKEEAVGRKASELYGTSEPPYLEVYAKVAESGEPTSFETYFSPMKKHFSISVFSLAKGMFATVFCDVTERKKAEEALRRSEEKLRATVASSPNAISVIDLNGNVIELNEAAMRLHGFSDKGEILGKSNFDYVIPKYRSKARELLDSTIKEGGARSAELTLLTVDGRELFTEMSANVVRDTNGKPLYVVIATKDVTERKRAELGFAESQEKFAALFSGNPEATVYTDTSMNILDVNSRFTSLFGYSLKEVRGKQLADTVVPQNLIKEGKMLDKKAGEGYVYHDTVRMRKDGSLIPVSVSAAPISIQGQLVGYIGVYKDTSRQKSAETKLAMMNEKLRVIGGLTRHDVRNKLSVITGNTYLNKKKLQDHPEIIESFKDIESACELIVRIFDFARDYERLGVEELTYIDVEDSVQKAASLFTNINGTKIVNDCHGLTVLADSLMTQLYYNLIDNSLKYGSQVTMIKIRYEESEGQLRLIYEDDGVGISQEAKLKLFQEGYTTGKGSGYGLYLIKKMMEVYGWTIQEIGMQGKGAQFVITIPRTTEQGKENYRTR
jgi:PAS domain S-box-containing protein